MKYYLQLLLVVFVSSLIRSALAHLHASSFPGYGFSWYDPVCGYACNDAIASAPLSCTSTESASEPTSPECRAGDTAFLTTLAYCMNATCDPAKVPAWQREKFWATQMTGDPAVVPKWDYATTLQEVRGSPAAEFNSSSEDTLNQTVSISTTTYEVQSRFMIMFDHLEMLQARYM